MSETAQVTKKEDTPTLQQFGVLVYLSLPDAKVRYQMRFDHLGRGHESVREERAGVLAQNKISLGTWRSILKRGWVTQVDRVGMSGIYHISESGRAAMEALIARSTTFAEIAELVRERAGM